MRKAKLMILFVIVIVCCALISVACGENDSKEPIHVHEYNSEWESDGTHHWHSATCEHAEEKDSYAEHELDEFEICTICSYQNATQGLEFSLNDDSKSYSVIGYGDVVDKRKIVIPSTYNDKPVTIIGKYAFRYENTLQEIIIPDSIEEIESYAFESCEGLEFVKISKTSNLQIIEDAFMRCISLKSIYIPKSVNSIAILTFYRCGGLNDIVVDEENETYLGINNCLIDIATKTLIRGANNSIIPDDERVAIIGSNAFEDCDSLQSVNIPSNITTIEREAFIRCSALESVIISNSVLTIDSDAFSGCTSLTKVILPNQLQKISTGLFQYSESLTSIIIPKTVVTIGGASFGYSALSKIYYEGTQTDKTEINIGGYNNAALTNATWYYYSETEPTDNGNYWHYDNDGNVVEW